MVVSLVDYTSVYSYEFILQRALSRVPDTIDKRQGSIIYDALAPACLELADAYIQMQTIIEQAFVLTMTGDYLDMKVAEAGLERDVATKAIRKGLFTKTDDTAATMTVGQRFSTITEGTPVYYVITEQYTENGTPVAGAYKLECETAGIVGNDYVGNILPAVLVPDLKSAEITDILVPGEDAETDDELRIRYLQKKNEIAFGGNIAHYKEWTKAVSGAGACQVYPVWNGGGTVKVSVLDTNYAKASQDIIDAVQEALDPGLTGEGLGVAPIGHTVTVVAPTEVEINVTADITLKSGYNLASVTALIDDAIQEHLLELRTKWEEGDDLNNYVTTVYLSKINSIIINIAGVEDIVALALNGSAANVVLTQNATTQQIPIMGVLNVS